ncbi:MAG: dethiobiotin synthase [bacterium]
MRGFFITGTDTEIGKTLVTALLAAGLRERGIACRPVKPLGAGGVMVEGRRVSGDAIVYQKLGGLQAPLADLNPLCLERPASPHFAAEQAGITLVPGDLLAPLRAMAERDAYLLVEGVGGWLTPITHDYTVADFARDSGLPVLVVSANRLGTLNHTLLTLESIRGRGLETAGVIFTHPHAGSEADMAANNVETIRRMGKVEILGNIPYLGECVEERSDPETIGETVKDAFSWERIIQKLHTQ